MFFSLKYANVWFFCLKSTFQTLYSKTKREFQRDTRTIRRGREKFPIYVIYLGCATKWAYSIKFIGGFIFPLLASLFHPPKSNFTPKSSVFIYRSFFKGIHMCFQPFKSSVRIRTFFKGIKGNSGSEKEKHGWEEKCSGLNSRAFPFKFSN
jgi:hypothetical protein